MNFRIKACFARSSSVKNDFEGTICALPISVGQPYHEAGKMLATAGLINKYFSKCIIVVCDSLQRHNAALYGNQDAASAYEEALKAGESWLKRNAKMFEQIAIPIELVRWNNWYKSEKYPLYLEKIEEMLRTDNNFSAILNNYANAFVEQHLAHYDEKIFSESIEKVIATCKNYLKEEAAVLCMWHDEGKYDFLAYPGNNNGVMVYVYDHLKQSGTKNKLVSLKVKFKKTSILTE